MNKLFMVALCSGIVVASACDGDPIPPKGVLDCDSGRCRDGAVDLRVDRSPPLSLDSGSGVDARPSQDGRPIVDLPTAGETPAAADAPVRFDAADANGAVDLSAAEAALPDDAPVMDQAQTADAGADVPLGTDASIDSPLGSDALADAAPDMPPVTLDVAYDTTPTVDGADQDGPGALDTATIDTGSDTTSACSGALCDDFEDGDATGWTVIGNGVAGDWAVALEGTNHVFQQNTDTSATLRLARAGQVGWTDQTVTVRLDVVGFGAAANANRTLLCARVVSAGSAYCLAISADGGGTLTLLKRRPQAGGAWDVLGTPATGVALAAGTWHTVRLAVSGSSPVTVSAYVDPGATATPTLTATDSTQTIVAGNIAVGTEGTQAAVDDVLVTIP